MSGKVEVSIIIPTKDRHNNLKACVETIIQSYSCYPYKELLVIDGSEDLSIREMNKKFIEKVGGRYYFETRRGVSLARNTGIRKSSGEILVFADDDFIVDKNWINKLIENYKDTDVMGCTGRMLTYRNDEISELYEKCMSFDRGEVKRIFTKKDISILKLLKTVTLIGSKRLFENTPVPWAVGYGFYSFRRKIFDDIGYFDENLGRGTTFVGGEDPDIFYRILKHNYKMVYDPNAIIYHNHRQKYEDILKDAHNGGKFIKAITTKYIMEKDVYMLFIFFGEFFLLLFTLLNSLFKSDENFKKMIGNEFKGFLEGPIYKNINQRIPKNLALKHPYS